MLALKNSKVLAPLGSNFYVELHHKINDQIRREQELIQQRVTWILTFQGFLFAAYGVALNHSSANDVRAETFLDVLPAAGFITALLAFVGILAAFRQVNVHKRQWLAYEHEFTLSGVQPFADFWGSIVGRLPIAFLPLCLAYIWFKLC